MNEVDPIAASDQDRERVKAFAQVLGSYFTSLLAQGFERPEALKLVRDYQAETFENGRAE